MLLGLKILFGKIIIDLYDMLLVFPNAWKIPWKPADRICLREQSAGLGGNGNFFSTMHFQMCKSYICQYVWERRVCRIGRGWALATVAVSCKLCASCLMNVPCLGEKGLQTCVQWESLSHVSLSVMNVPCLRKESAGLGGDRIFSSLCIFKCVNNLFANMNVICLGEKSLQDWAGMGFFLHCAFSNV